MATLANLIAAARVRLGLPEAGERGWHPRSAHVQRAFDALRDDDIDRAIAEWSRAWRAEPGEEAAVGREVILMKLDAEEDRLTAREAEAKKLRDTAEGEITLLDLRLRRLRFSYQLRQVWVVLVVGAAVVASSLLSVLRFDLHAAMAASGLLAFAAGAALLIGVDRRRQRAAFEAYRARVSAGVAEEMQILRSLIRSHESELLAARADRERTRARRARLLAPEVQPAVSESGPPPDPDLTSDPGSS